MGLFIFHNRLTHLIFGISEKYFSHFAEIIAKQSGSSIIIHYPDWNTHGKSAGFIRNTLIAEDCDVLIACVAEDRKGGTEDTIKKVKALEKKVYLV